MFMSEEGDRRPGVPRFYLLSLMATACFMPESVTIEMMNSMLSPC